MGKVTDGYAKFQRNLSETVDGKPAYIYFRVCDRFGCSNPSWYKV